MYQPDFQFRDRMLKLVSQVGSLVVVDNGSAMSCMPPLKEFAEIKNVHLILNNRNEGVAHALNQGAEWAVAQGFSWILTLDQDTVVQPDMVVSLCAIYQDFPDRMKLAVLGSNYTISSIGKPFLATGNGTGSSWLEVKTTITSGSLISLSVYREIGPFREELFIDCVDFEYCLRARSMGFHVVMTRKILMEHGIGKVTAHFLPWKATTTSNHSPTRRYYMTRNQLLLARQYFRNEPSWMISMLYTHLKATILVCVFEKDAWAKLKFTALGFWDGLFRRFNRRLDEVQSLGS